MDYLEYLGMSYEQASREVQRLCERGGWFRNFDRISALRQIMYMRLTDPPGFREGMKEHDNVRR
jgi:hypothetical protein